MTTLIVDGNSIMHRSYWATSNLTNGAVLTFLNTLYRTVSDISAESVIVAFDTHAPTFRHKMYAEYKAGRRETPDDLRAQFDIIKEILPTLPSSIITLEGYEADDILGTLAKRDSESYVMTGDRDALQLVEYAKVILVGNTQNKIYDRDVLMKEYGLTPSQYLEYKALVGDKSDNIIGADGIGDKIATKLLTKYGKYGIIYSNRGDLSPKISKSIEEFNERYDDVMKLVTIDCDAPIEITDTKPIDFTNAAFLDKLSQYNFKSLHKRLTKELVQDTQMGFL